MPVNVGKYMRVQAVASLREVQRQESQGQIPDADDEDFVDELNVCCHGRAAAEEVLSLFCHEKWWPQTFALMLSSSLRQEHRCRVIDASPAHQLNIRCQRQPDPSPSFSTSQMFCRSSGVHRRRAPVG